MHTQAKRKRTAALGAVAAIAAAAAAFTPMTANAAAAPSTPQVRPAVVPASAPEVQVPAAVKSAAVASGGNYTYVEFKKGSSALNSRLKFIYVQATNPDHVRAWTIDSWRAGSGNGSKDSCATNRGWLPNGTYKIKKFYWHHNGGARGVNGIAWDIGNHKCHSGKWRTELFIHSKMKPNGQQGSGPYRWTGSYASNGCIKLSPHDIRELAGYRSNYPHPGKLYVD
ncbi:L,D-transpeptidase family protein [Actinomycetota bacterium Odt1-20B]